MQKICALTLLNFIQGIREKLFWQVIFFFVFILAVTFFMGILSLGEAAFVLRSAGLSGIEASAILLIVTSLIFNSFREKESRLTEFLLAHFSRFEYITGKLAGYLLIGFLYIALAGAGFVAVLLLNAAFTSAVFIGLSVLYLKLSIITAVALVFATLFSSNTLALFSTFFFYIAAEVSRQALAIIIISKQETLKGLFTVLYSLLPAMDKLDIKSLVTFGRVPEPGFMCWISLYTVLYVLFLWGLATAIFSKKEI